MERSERSLKIIVPNSYGLGVKVFADIGTKGLPTDRLNHESVCRTALATPGLIKIDK